MLRVKDKRAHPRGPESCEVSVGHVVMLLSWVPFSQLSEVSIHRLPRTYQQPYEVSTIFLREKIQGSETDDD